MPFPPDLNASVGASVARRRALVGVRPLNVESGPGRLRGGSFVWSLVLGLMLLAQTLGLVHSIAHNPQAGSGHDIELRHLHDAHADDDAAQGWLGTLFAGHEEGGDHCRVFDHQGHSVLMTTVAALALPSVLHAFVPFEWTGCLLAASSAPFDARGPPFPH